MSCKICHNKVNRVFSSKILNKYNIDYFYCKNCGFLQTEEPYWLKESYNESINITDTGIMARNIYMSKISSGVIYFFFDKRAVFVDYAGGYGIFTRLMRDFGFNFYWHDPYTKNVLARGLEYTSKIKNIELLTTFESFEHFVNPVKEMNKMFSISKNILFSTELLSNPIPKPEEWYYYGLDHGQHISFYSSKTLKFIAQKYNLNVYSMGTIHLLTEKKINPFFFKSIKFLACLDLFNKLLKKKMPSKIISDNILLKKCK